MRGVSVRTNELGQPIGEPVADWGRRPSPLRAPMQGRFCSVEPLRAADHAAALFASHSLDAEGRNWTYLPYGPFGAEDEYRAWVESKQSLEDPVFYAIVATPAARPVGVASYLRIDPDMGVIEVGHLSYSPVLQRTAAATEAMYLMMRHAFDDLGYRRYEWKCDSHNHPSRNAALRLGFRFEGIFRQAVVMKGRNRDTAWYSITDTEWPELRTALAAWLDPANFDSDGRQLTRLESHMAGRQPRD
jgi:RimJ/RimL family protein N-acetyltransferase